MDRSNRDAAEGIRRGAPTHPPAWSRSQRGRRPCFGSFLLAFASVVVLTCSAGAASASDEPPSREEVVGAMRKATEFFTTQVSMEGAYHFAYTEDLSYGRSEAADTRTRVEVQREGTPVVAMAFLAAYEATGERVFLEAARQSAHAYVKGQHCSGGWDYSIEFDPDLRRQFPYRVDGACESDEPWAVEARRRHVTNLDDNVTQAGMRVLMRVDRALNFEDEKIHEASRYALESLMKAQYPNGAWPQRYNRFPDPRDHPVKRASYPEEWPREWPGPDYDFRGHYTFNDNSIVDMIDVMLEAARIYDEPRYRASAEKGGDFILLAQMPEPQPGWAQQYDENMHPAWARLFEPPGVTGGESRGVMRGLVMLYRETGDEKYLKPLPRALEYYKNSALPPVDDSSEIRRRACPEGTKYCLARFYELKTNRPLYITKGSRVHVRGRPTAFVDGYEISYSDESVITHYGVLTRGDELDEIEAEYRKLAAAEPETIRRSEKLWGLSPWSGSPAPTAAGLLSQPHLPSRQALEPQVREILNAPDERGAWVEEGRIGLPNRLVAVFAARDMVVTLGDQASHMKENDMLTIFEGEQPPMERIIRSVTLARNFEILTAYLMSLDR